MSDEKFNKMQLLKRRMFAMRNGVIADTLRQAGCPRRIVFGLNLPQLTEIAAEFGPDSHLARQLLADKNVRESHLLAPMLFAREDVSEAEALRLAHNIAWPEEADILCNKLLRWLPFAENIAETLCDEPDRLNRYTGLRLWLAMTCVNQATELRSQAVAAARKEIAREDAIAQLANQIIADNDY